MSVLRATISAKIVAPLLDPSVRHRHLYLSRLAATRSMVVAGCLSSTNGSRRRYVSPPCRDRDRSPSARRLRCVELCWRGIGGFMSIADQLADDYRLGELTRRMGLRTVLSDVVVETCVDERSLGDLVRHELRWLRTIRAVRPVGMPCPSSLSAYPWPRSAVCWPPVRRRRSPCSESPPRRGSLLHLAVRKPGSALSHLLVLPLRDTLSFALWGWSSPRAACTGGTTIFK